MAEMEACKDCSKWEETMYWTHFQKLHFCLTLVGDFVNELAIPKKFANHLKKKLPEAVTLKGPSGVKWDIGLVTRGDNLFFKNGWKEFVINYSLEEDDLLMFQYHGDSGFDVMMFDRQSLCEKETAYFVRNYGKKRPDVGNQMTENARGNFVEDVHVASDDCVGCGNKEYDVGCQIIENTMENSVDAKLDDNIGSHFPKNPRKDEHVIAMQSIRHNNVPRARRKTQKVTRMTKPATSKRQLRTKKLSNCTVRAKVIAEVEHNSITGSNTYKEQYISNRRPITESEKHMAVQLAQAALTPESFIVVMRPTHVYNRFYVTIPSEWEKRHLSLENQDIFLSYKENTWCARYNRNKVRGFGGLVCGWKDFSVENNLEEHDVCRFELTNPASSTVVLIVSIFRVVNELMPLTLVTSDSPSRQKKPEKC